jgi:hypothetical protein
LTTELGETVPHIWIGHHPVLVQPTLAALASLERDGLLVLDDPRMTLTEAGRAYLRTQWAS